MKTAPFKSFALCFCFLLTTDYLKAQYVLPTLGGDQETPTTGASMKHASISFDGTDISVELDNSVPTPLLRELQAPNEFDPTESWSVLANKSYNAQHGWVIAGAWSPPSGLAVWIEEISSSPEMEVYEGGMYMSSMMIELQTFDPIFGTNGSSSRWQWGGTMTHNAYAVVDPMEASYEATYEVYLGDATTGEPSTQYGSDTITFSFVGVAVPEPTSVLLLTLATISFTCFGRRS